MKPTSTRSPRPGLTVGCAPGLYCRNDSVNRAQMAAFLARALDLPAATKDYFSDDNSFSLEPEINAAAAGRPDRRLRRQPLLPSGRGHPRADGGLHPASLQARLSPRPVGRPHRNPPHYPVPVANGTFVRLSALDPPAYGLEPVTEAVLTFVRRRHATNLLAFLLLATSAIPASAASPTAARRPRRPSVPPGSHPPSSPRPSRTTPASARASTGKRSRSTRTTRSISRRAAG